MYVAFNKDSSLFGGSMKFLVTICSLIIFTSGNLIASINLSDYSSLKDPQRELFIEHIVESDPKSFGNALALSIPYGAIVTLRKKIEKQIGKKLDYFKGWNPAGEAHVTTISPPEFVNVLRHGISMKRINEIAREQKIQKADVKLLSIGSGKKVINGKEEETFFVIVDSNSLRNIRFKIYKEFVANGGNAKSFDPSWFFPHITIGYTLKDIHEPDVLKDIEHSFDDRFKEINKTLLNLN